MTKEQRSIVTEYASTLSEEDLRFLTLRLSERYSGDLPDALNLMATDPKMDAILQETDSANQLFDMLDRIRDIFGKEFKRKVVGLKHSPMPV